MLLRDNEAIDRRSIGKWAKKLGFWAFSAENWQKK